MSAFIKKITAIEYFPDGVNIYTEDGQSCVQSSAWFAQNKPTTGDYLTHCNDGYYSVCRNNAFNAIRQVYHV